MELPLTPPRVCIHTLAHKRIQKRQGMAWSRWKIAGNEMATHVFPHSLEPLFGSRSGTRSSAPFILAEVSLAPPQATSVNTHNKNTHTHTHTQHHKPSNQISLVSWNQPSEPHRVCTGSWKPVFAGSCPRPPKKYKEPHKSWKDTEKDCDPEEAVCFLVFVFGFCLAKNGSEGTVSQPRQSTPLSATSPRAFQPWPTRDDTWKRIHASKARSSGERSHLESTPAGADVNQSFLFKCVAPNVKFVYIFNGNGIYLCSP